METAGSTSCNGRLSGESDALPSQRGRSEEPLRWRAVPPAALRMSETPSLKACGFDAARANTAHRTEPWSRQSSICGKALRAEALAKIEKLIQRENGHERRNRRKNQRRRKPDERHDDGNQDGSCEYTQEHPASPQAFQPPRCVRAAEPKAAVAAFALLVIDAALRAGGRAKNPARAPAVT